MKCLQNVGTDGVYSRHALIGREGGKNMQASIQDINGLDIYTQQTVYHGADQDWFSSAWRRKAGCGPTTGANILRYLGDRVPIDLPDRSKEGMQALMERVWGYITPGVFGLNSTRMFQEGMDRLLLELGSPLRCRVLDVPSEYENRPSRETVADFFRQAFEEDSPIAFLNLDRGQLFNLESWHWISLVAAELKGRDFTATAVDNGRFLKLDMGLWLETTRRNGGFVYLAA